MSTRTLDSSIIQILIRNNIIQQSLHLRSSPDIIGDFSFALKTAIQENDFGLFVSPQSKDDLWATEAVVFLSRDKMAGVAVWPDGNIGALFHNKNSRVRPARPELLLAALSNGGNKLDCFDGMLAQFYGDAGFLPVARTVFDYEFAPRGWRNEWGTPDIIFWIHNGDDPRIVASMYGKYPKITASMLNTLPVFQTYDEAYNYRDSLLTKK